MDSPLEEAGFELVVPPREGVAASGSTTTALPTGITLELVDSRQTANLARREADMALRHEPPETGDFYISKAGTFACAVYRRRGADAGA